MALFHVSIFGKQATSIINNMRTGRRTRSPTTTTTHIPYMIVAAAGAIPPLRAFNSYRVRRALATTRRYPNNLGVAYDDTACSPVGCQRVLFLVFGAFTCVSGLLPKKCVSFVLPTSTAVTGLRSREEATTTTTTNRTDGSIGHTKQSPGCCGGGHDRLTAAVSYSTAIDTRIITVR